MKSLSYVATDTSGTRIDARTFGYFSARWAAESAFESRKALTRKPLDQIDGLSFAARVPYHVILILTALHGAAYWIFASTLPNIKFGLSTEECAAVLTELKAGRDDAIREFKLPNGENIPESVFKFLTSQFNGFYNALTDDTANRLTRNHEELSIRPSNACQRFLKIAKDNYGSELNESEQLILTVFIDETAAATLDSIGQRMIAHSS